jgi:hypothetical protein
VLVLVELGVLSTAFPSGDVGLQAGLVFALASLVVGVPLLRQVAWPSVAHRRLLVGVLLALSFADLTRYFWVVEHADVAFTVGGRYEKPIAAPLPPRVQAALRRPWAAPDPAQEWNGGVDRNMPVASDFWPQNFYIAPRYLVELVNAGGTSVLGPRPALSYFSSAQVHRVHGEGAEMAEIVGRPAELVLAPDGRPPPDAQASTAGSQGQFEYRFRSWGYNRFTIDLRVPDDGWLLITQLFDPAWRVVVDGTAVAPWRAEHMLMAVPVSAAARTLEMDYRPRARALYWPTAALVVATAAGLAAASARSARSAAGKRPARGGGARTTAAESVDSGV